MEKNGSKQNDSKALMGQNQFVFLEQEHQNNVTSRPRENKLNKLARH